MTKAKKLFREDIKLIKILTWLILALLVILSCFFFIS